MALTNYDSIIAARSSGQYEDPFWFKSESITPLAAGQWCSLLNCAGVPSSLTITSAAGGVAMCNTHAGAIPISTNSTTLSRYLLSAGVGGLPSVAGFGAMMLLDVLWGIKGIPYTGATYDINSTGVPLTRSTSGLGNQLMLVIDTSHTSATNTTAIVTYTNSDGTTGRTSSAVMTTASRAHHIRPAGNVFMNLAAGDLGVKSVEKIVFNATIAGGVCSLFIVKPILVIPTVAANAWVERDITLQIEGLTVLQKGSDDKLPFLGFAGLAAGTGACATFHSQIRTVYG